MSSLATTLSINGRIGSARPSIGGIPSWRPTHTIRSGKDAIGAMKNAQRQAKEEHLAVAMAKNVCDVAHAETTYLRGGSWKVQAIPFLCLCSWTVNSRPRSLF